MERRSFLKRLSTAVAGLFATPLAAQDWSGLVTKIPVDTMTTYFHRGCDGVVLYKAGRPWLPGDPLRSKDVWFPDGTRARPNTAKAVICSKCNQRVRVQPEDLYYVKGRMIDTEDYGRVPVVEMEIGHIERFRFIDS